MKINIVFGGPGPVAERDEIVAAHTVEQPLELLEQAAGAGRRHRSAHGVGPIGQPDTKRGKKLKTTRPYK